MLNSVLWQQEKQFDVQEQQIQLMSLQILFFSAKIGKQKTHKLFD